MEELHQQRTRCQLLPVSCDTGKDSLVQWATRGGKTPDAG